jgi:pimeloyl-ACP methyl ester carboxylesterase
MTRNAAADVGDSAQSLPERAARWSTRVDEGRRIREELEFFGPTPSKLFGCLHAPLDRPFGGLVICSPVHAEFLKNYRREVDLARVLAGRGIAVQRFHYRGTGNSEGEAEEATFDSMCEDVAFAAERLVDKTGVTNLAFLGTRWGALTAAAAARNFPGVPLALWEPVTDPRRNFTQIYRAALIPELKEGGTRALDEPAIQQLERNGSLDILGYSIHWSQYENAVQHSLDGLLGEDPRPLLLVQISRRDELRGDHARLLSRLKESGFSIANRIVAGDETWWFASEPSQVAVVSNGLIDVTTRWLLDCLPARSS